MHEKQDNEDRHDEVCIQNLHELSKRVAMSFTLRLQVAIWTIFCSCACHDKEIEGKIDVRLDEDKTEETCGHAIDTVGELRCYVKFVATKSKNLVYSFDEDLVVSFDVDTKELFNSSLWVDK